MRVLFQSDWRGGFLDTWRSPDDYRLAVRSFANLAKLDQLYFVPRRSARLILNYLWELGPRDVLQKVLSRSRERVRNEKFLSIGTGHILEKPKTGRFSIGQEVLFIAPCQPACLDRLVLPERLLGEVGAGFDVTPAEAIRYLACDKRVDQTLVRQEPWSSLRGWSPYSGRELEEDACRAALDGARTLLPQLPWSNARPLDVDSQEVAREHARPLGSAKPEGSASKRRRRGVLFGYGNYAKTMTVPTLAPVCDLEVVHEIDPAAMNLNEAETGWDTSPGLREDENPDVCMIAGFHHTHAPLAVEAMQRGAVAVVEKPLATTWNQLESLVAELRGGRGRFFGCFQKRYHPFNAWAYEDLGAKPGDPISYHCVVYEVPIPELHWYAWPNSGSRIISNGCHWIDHFLHLNPHADVVSQQLTLGPDETVNCSVVLANGAMFTMVLTEQGSSRLGVREHVELRAHNGTVTITDGCVYHSETTEKVVRRKKIHRYAAHRAMYVEIGRKIAAEEPGDSVESLQRSTALVLQLEQLLQEQRARGKNHAPRTTIGVS